MLYVFVLAFQSIAIGYKQQNPTSVVVVMAYDSRPSLRIKSSDSEESFRRYRFVDAIQELDPAGALGLMAPDYKVCIAFYRLISFIFGFYNLRSVIQTLSFFRLPTALLAEVSLASSRHSSWSFPTTTVRLPPQASANDGFQPQGRGHKHRLEDDQMSVESNSKRQDFSSSAEKNKTKNKPKNKNRVGK